MSIDKITKTIELKVGDYVRNKYGIAKVLEISEDVVKQIQTIKFDRPICFWVNPKTEEERNRTNILPITPNIDLDKIKIGKLIDLIEVGDYVNGIQINDRIGDSVWHFSTYGDDDECLENKDIKTIVTHEQMEAMEYKIER